MELCGGLCPAGAGAPCRRDDDPTAFRVQLDLAAEASVFEEWLGNSNALGVADGNDAGL